MSDTLRLAGVRGMQAAGNAVAFGEDVANGFAIGIRYIGKLMNAQEHPCEILLAEDSAADVVLVREALREHDISCALRIVKDGAQAIAFIEHLDSNAKASRLDLLILDMHLPKHDGEDILKVLRSTERYAQTPVIVMTASSSPHDERTAERHAALHYFRKPSTLAQFLQLGGIVKEILTGKPPGTHWGEDRDSGGVA